MLEIDGSYHEGGGQIVRTSVALSALTGTPVRITNIRAKRCNPGLAAQHLASIEALAKVCGAKVSGASIGSTAVEFFPGELKEEHHDYYYSIDVGTAGAIPLVLQTLILPAVFAENKILFELVGGTHVKWSPTMDYFSTVFCFFIRRIGAEIAVEVKKYGFYPKGGGRVSVSVAPVKNPVPVDFVFPGKLKDISLLSAATEGLRGAKVSERQVLGFEKAFGQKCSASASYIPSDSVGSSFFAIARFENSVIGASALGEIGKPAEAVGEEAATVLKKQVASGACLDEWMADQILPYLALSGGKVSVAKVTPHARTNIWVIERFFGNVFDFDEKAGTVAVPRPIETTMQ